MKTKLTLYVDKAAVKRGKLWARRRNIPLSQVVERHLNRLAAPDAGERFLAKWQGAFKLDPAALKDKRDVIMVACDHLTPVARRTHTGDPVPFLLWRAGMAPSGVSRFNEKTAAAAGYVLEHGPLLLGHALKLARS